MRFPTSCSRLPFPKERVFLQLLVASNPCQSGFVANAFFQLSVSGKPISAFPAKAFFQLSVPDSRYPGSFGFSTFLSPATLFGPVLRRRRFSNFLSPTAFANGVHAFRFLVAGNPFQPAFPANSFF
jgi:hypothetical protein